MRCPLIAFLVLLPLWLHAEEPYDSPVLSPDAEYSAVFLESTDEQTKSEFTKLTIKDRKGHIIFKDDIYASACGARWTDDGQFLVITGMNGAGHSPWHYNVHIFSLAAHEVRRLNDPDSTPFVSSEIWCQPPNTVILVGHTFVHHIAAPDDPVILRFELNKAWPKLKKG